MVVSENHVNGSPVFSPESTSENLQDFFTGTLKNILEFPQKISEVYAGLHPEIVLISFEYFFRFFFTRNFTRISQKKSCGMNFLLRFFQKLS